MKILIFEYITGGGFNKQELPDTLKHEGHLMLQALLDNLLGLDTIELIVMLDQRLIGTIDVGHHEIAVIKKSQHCNEEFIRLIQQCDAVWPIAPEFDNILQALCESVEHAGKQLLTSPSSAVYLTGNKYLTYQHLQKYAIATVPTCLLVTNEILDHNTPEIIAAHPPKNTNEWIIKPITGVGCMDSWLISDLCGIAAISNKDAYIIQPHLHGKKTSLSCVFKKGQAWIASINEQHFSILEQRYQLASIVVNNDSNIDRYQDMVDEIAFAFPELWGYVGIDLIETPENILVLEINPRLTTAFVGIEQALGINIADIVLQLLMGTPTIKPRYNKAITITLTPNTPTHA